MTRGRGFAAQLGSPSVGAFGMHARTHMQRSRALADIRPAVQGVFSFPPIELHPRRVRLSRRWVVSQLEVDGEDAVARIRGLDLLLAALACLAEPLGLQTTAPYGRRVTLAGGGAGAAPAAAPGGVGGGAAAAEGAAVPAELRGIWSWWAARALLLQQQALSGRSATIQAALTPALDAAAAWAAALGGGEAAGVSERDARRLRAALHLEAARAHQAYGVVDAAQRQLELAGDALGVTVSTWRSCSRCACTQVAACAEAGLRPTRADATSNQRAPNF